jgi:hypothetical protein
MGWLGTAQPLSPPRLGSFGWRGPTWRAAAPLSPPRFGPLGSPLGAAQPPLRVGATRTPGWCRWVVFGRRLCAWDPPGSRGKIAPCSSPPTSRCPFFSHLAQLALLASRPCKIAVATIVEVSSSSSSPFPSPFSPPFFSVARGVPQPRSAASIFPCVRGVARPVLGHGATARGPSASPARSDVRSPSPCAQPGESVVARPLRARSLPSAWRRVARSPARSPGSASTCRGLRPASAWRRGVPGAALRATSDSPARSTGSASARRGLCPASAWRRDVPIAAWRARGRPAQPARAARPRRARCSRPRRVRDPQRGAFAAPARRRVPLASQFARSTLTAAYAVCSQRLARARGWSIPGSSASACKGHGQPVRAIIPCVVACSFVHVIIHMFWLSLCVVSHGDSLHHLSLLTLIGLC